MKYVAVFHSHRSSVKSVAAHPYDPSLFATAGRDGSIFVFDIRCTTKIQPETGNLTSVFLIFKITPFIPLLT